MNFYKKCLGGSISFMTVAESPMAKDLPADKQNLIMHAELTSKDIVFYGSDMMRDKVAVGDNVGMALNCKSEEEIKDLFSKLSEGGEVFMPLEDAFWGATFGMVTDKYGVEWMLNFQKKPIKK